MVITAINKEKERVSEVFNIYRKNLKIAIITDSIEKGPTSIGKYTENLVKKLLEIETKDNKIDIILIHGQRRNLDIYKKSSEVIIPFFKRRKYSLFPIRVLVFLLMVFYNIKRSLEIIKFCEKNNIDVLHIPHLGRKAPSIVYLVYRFTKNLSFIITNHGMANLALPSKLCYREKDITRLIDYFEYLKWKYLFRNRFEIIISVSYSEKRNISKNLKIFPEKIVVIYHGVDYRSYYKSQLKKNREILYRNYGINFPFIFHLSAYQPKKNLENIIKAFAIAKKTYKIKEKLVIGGRQPNHLKKLAKDLGIEDDIIFVGFIPEEELPLFYSRAEVFIFPSFHESFGMPILEAMACGCPVITSNVFSMPEVVGKAAILVDPYNVKEIANAIYKVVSDKKLRRKLAKRGIERAKKFTWERCAKEHLKVYKKVIRDDNYI